MHFKLANKMTQACTIDLPKSIFSKLMASASPEFITCMAAGVSIIWELKKDGDDYKLIGRTEHPCAVVKTDDQECMAVHSKKDEQ